MVQASMFYFEFSHLHVMYPWTFHKKVQVITPTDEMDETEVLSLLRRTYLFLYFYIISSFLYIDSLQAFAFPNDNTSVNSLLPTGITKIYWRI